MTALTADPRIAGRIISGDPSVTLAAVVDQLTPEQMRAALHRLAALTTCDVPHEPGTMLVAEGPADFPAAYEWDDGIGGWRELHTGDGPYTLDEIRDEHGDREASPRLIDGWWHHNSALITAIVGGTE